MTIYASYPSASDSWLVFACGSLAPFRTLYREILTTSSVTTNNLASGPTTGSIASETTIPKAGSVSSTAFPLVTSSTGPGPGSTWTTLPSSLPSLTAARTSTVSSPLASHETSMSTAAGMSQYSPGQSTAWVVGAVIVSVLALVSSTLFALILVKRRKRMRAVAEAQDPMSEQTQRLLHGQCLL